MEKIYDFLKEAGVYYLATMEGDQPRVRPFGTVLIYEGKLYIQTGKVKPVSKQIATNPKVEICAFKGDSWLRVAGELVADERVEAKKAMLDEYANLRTMYDENDDNTQVLYFKSGTATFSSFSASEEVIEEKTEEIAENEYPLANVTLGGVSLCEFAIEREYKIVGASKAADEIKEWLAEKTGIVPQEDKNAANRIRFVSDPKLDLEAASVVLENGIVTLAINPYGRSITDAVDLFYEVMENRSSDELDTINETDFNLEKKHQLKYLNNTYAKLMSGEEINISFTGGSVTGGMGASIAAETSWVALISSRFEDTYGVKVNRNNASIGGTGTYLASFRYEHQIKPANPDLLFIEHTVNDKYAAATYDEVVRASETLVLKAYEQNPNVDIIYVLTFDQNDGAMDYTQLKAHRDVAEKYGLMYVKLSSHFYSHIAATGERFSNYFTDHVHPNDNGYAEYTDFIWKTIQDDFPAEKTAVSVKAHTWDDEPLSTPMLDAHMVYSDEIPLDDSEGWVHQDEDFSYMGKSYHGRLYASKPGAKLTYTFEGTDFGIFYGKGPNMGKISITIDGGEPYILDGYLSYSNPKGAQIATFLEDGSHIVIIELFDGSCGSEFEIGSLLIN